MDRIIGTSGNICGAPYSWRDAMVNASAAVGGPCVWTIVGPASYLVHDNIQGDNSVVDVSEFITRHWANSAFSGGSGNYQVAWETGPEVVSHGVTVSDYTDYSGNVMARSHQTYSFQPAGDAHPYLTTITARVNRPDIGNCRRAQTECSRLSVQFRL